MKRRHSTLRRMLAAFRSAPGGLTAAAILFGLVLVAILGPIIWGSQAQQLNTNDALMGASSHHWLGTDRLGRDVLARTLSAGRLSLVLSLSAAAIAGLGGVLVGATITSLGPRLQSVARRCLDGVLAFPPILTAIFATAVLGTSAGSAAIAVGLAGTPNVARIVSTLTGSIARRDFVSAAWLSGMSRRRVFFRHILPNIAETLVVTLSVVAGASLVFVSSLSFLGIGVQPPQCDWGQMLSEGMADVFLTPLRAVAPALAIAVAGLAFGLFGEGVARVLSPVTWTYVPQRGHVALKGSYKARWSRHMQRPELRTQAGGTQPDPDPLAILETRDLSVSLPSENGPLALVNGIDLSVRQAEILGIVGESGSGKTMTLLALAGLLPYPATASHAIMRFEGDDLGKPSGRSGQRALAKLLALVFQDPMSSLNPALKISVQVAEGSRTHKGIRWKEAVLGARTQLENVNLPDPDRVLHQYPHELSGGMRQRVMIASGLMMEPRLLLADEPTTALDVTVQKQVLQLLKRVNRTSGTAIILVSHDFRVIRQMCDRVLVMYAGRVVEEGPTDEVMSNPAHPYTRLLRGCSIDMETDVDLPLPSVPGHAPKPGQVSAGCSFALRCPLVADRCRTDSPALVGAGPHRVACWVVDAPVSTGSAS